jgi:tRNA-specific 2-thiouridylase
MSISLRKKSNKKEKVLIALSGGIDSAVSAYLLQKAGYEVEGAFMKNWSSTAGLKYDECPWLTDRQDALRVAAFLHIPLRTLDFEKEYKKTVLNYFFEEYKAGRTPNPDVMCNKEIKFKLLYNWAMKHQFNFLATGHYAQVKSTKSGYQLTRSSDEFKDQTYFIYNIKTEQLPHVLFPIGGMKKSSVRALARRIKLPNADKKESMGLCFVGRIRLKDFLEQKLKRKPGPILDMGGKKIGQHEGLHYYTIGQRQGIKVGSGGPYFVARKDLAKNALYVTNDAKDKALEIKELEIHSVNWISPPARFPAKLTGRFRHQGKLEKLTVTKNSIFGHSKKSKKNTHGGRAGNSTGDEIYKIVFAKPQKAVASGQSLVLYDKKVCVGGGVIV